MFLRHLHRLPGAAAPAPAEYRTVAPGGRRPARTGIRPRQTSTRSDAVPAARFPGAPRTTGTHTGEIMATAALSPTCSSPRGHTAGRRQPRTRPTDSTPLRTHLAVPAGRERPLRCGTERELSFEISKLMVREDPNATICRDLRRTYRTSPGPRRTAPTRPGRWHPNKRARPGPLRAAAPTGSPRPLFFLGACF